jgi:hypothetical protein
VLLFIKMRLGQTLDRPFEQPICLVIMARAAFEDLLSKGFVQPDAALWATRWVSSLPFFRRRYLAQFLSH